MLKKICILVCLSITLCLFACKTEEPTTEITEEQQIYLPEVEIEGFSNEDYLDFVKFAKEFGPTHTSSSSDFVAYSLESLVYYVTVKKTYSFYEIDMNDNCVYLMVYYEGTKPVDFENCVYVFSDEDNFEYEFQGKTAVISFLIQSFNVLKNHVNGEVLTERGFYYGRPFNGKVSSGSYMIAIKKDTLKTFNHYVYENYAQQNEPYKLIEENNAKYFKDTIYVTRNENGEVSYSGRYSLYPELDNILQYSEKHYQEDRCGLINLDDFIKYVNSLIEEPE